MELMNKRNQRQLPDTQFGKLPPQSVETEEAILGALMLEKNALEVITFLKTECFYKDAHKTIFEAILQLVKACNPVDIKTVVHQLRKCGQLEFVGGAHYVSDLTSKVNSAANIEYHARIVFEQYIKREYIRISGEIQQEAYEDSTDAFDLQNYVESQLQNIFDQTITNEPVSIKKLSIEGIEDVEKRKRDHEKQGITGIPSGFLAIDNATSGWQPSDLIILAARPGMGKTAFILSALRNASLIYKIPVAMFSLEMYRIQLINRMGAMQAEVGYERLKSGKYSDNEFEKYIEAMGKLSDTNLWIDDTPDLSITQFQAKARKLVLKYGVKLIAVDYLQLMKGDSTNNRAGNREQEISSISRGLKKTAKELNVPVIALSQLSRSVETRGDKRPQLSDLRESGSIEQDADMVIFLYRPEYYGTTVDDNGTSTKGIGEVIISKHRNGELVNKWLKFIGWKMEWTNYDQETDHRESTGDNNDFNIVLPEQKSVENMPF